MKLDIEALLSALPSNFMWSTLNPPAGEMEIKFADNILTLVYLLERHYQWRSPPVHTEAGAGAGAEEEDEKEADLVAHDGGAYSVPVLGRNRHTMT